jgi:hypothetical protein
MVVARSTFMRTVLCLVLSGLVTSGAAGLVGCVRPVEVHSASLPTAPFGQYHTFSFADPEGAPEGYRMSPRSAEVQRRLKPLFVTVLEQKGYTLATGKGDFVLAYGSVDGSARFSTRSGPTTGSTRTRRTTSPKARSSSMYSMGRTTARCGTVRRVRASIRTGSTRRSSNAPYGSLGLALRSA